MRSKERMGEGIWELASEMYSHRERERERERKRVHGHAVVGPLGQVNGEKRQGRHARNVLQANCNLAYIFFV
jgi:hypothetical protein